MERQQAAATRAPLSAMFEARLTAPPAEQLAVVKFLRTKAGMKTRQGVFNGRRQEYFKGSRAIQLTDHRTDAPMTGKSAISALLSPAYGKLANVPPVADEAAAINLLISLIPLAFFLRVNRGDPLPPSAANTAVTAAAAKGQNIRPLQINPQQMMAKDEFYAWFYDGPQWTLILGAVGMVAVVLAGVMFPLWPVSLRIGVWYLSIGVLGLVGAFFGLAVVRLIVWIVTRLSMKTAIWIYPNLFEDVGFVRSHLST
jgi:translocation protein SEC62